ncbi:MAG: hypothetical protein VB018_04250 [Lachnospiraceae bacterium]|nr:hypothetical protein [Lachnospiraceae bacterium]
MEKTCTFDTVLEWLLVLLISGSIMLVGNFVGFGNSILTAIPGMLILIAISVIGLFLAKIIPIKIPAICYISIIGILIAVPSSPVSSYVVDACSKINLLAICTPVLAYTGVSIGKSWSEFKKIGWRGVIVTLMVMFGTFFTSALFAQLLLNF